jgi:hypothetical protein
MRAQAFATGDGAMLQAADAAGSSALDADLAILKQLESSQVLLQGISFHVGDVTVLDESARVATLRLTAATGAHQVVRRDGSVVATVPQGPAAPVVITRFAMSECAPVGSAECRGDSNPRVRPVVAFGANR